MFGRRGPRTARRADEDGIYDEIIAINLRRIYRLSLILVPVHLAHIIIFALQSPTDDPISSSWRKGILIAHSVMLPLAVVLASTARHAARRKGDPALFGWLRGLVPGFGMAIYLSFGVALALIDQQVTTSITPLLLTAVGVASAILIPPLTAAALFASLLIGFWILIGWTQPDPDIVLSIRLNSISLTGVGFGVAYLLWQSQITSLRQRREIEVQKIALEERNEELALLANRDPLTGVANRSQLRSVGALEIARMRRRGGEAALVLIDLDDFKSINDTYGHPAGDAVLHELAQVLQSEVRSIDTLARIGGEEFAILLPDTTLRDAVEMAERVRISVEEHTFEVEGAEIRLTASLGVAPLEIDGRDPLDAAYNTADQMLYHAKDAGRNQIRVAGQGVYDSCHSIVESLESLESSDLEEIR